ncbi:MAG: HPr family phosphocarrier protein [Acidobacteria bacterium]|nr:HPr family phosphocarrier protein [Acidobacteriota bacterium]
MVQRQVVICNKLGLHARAAAKLARIASTFQCNIRLARVGKNEFINGKSVLGILMMAAGVGTHLWVTAEGADEVAAVAAIEELVNSRFGERG